MSQTYAVIFTAAKYINNDLYLPETSTIKIVVWIFHVDDIIEWRYDVIIGREIVMALGLEIKSYKQEIIYGVGL